MDTSAVAALALTLLGVVATGAAISAVIARLVAQIPPWLSIGAYCGPAVLAFGLYAVLARRL